MSQSPSSTARPVALGFCLASSSPQRQKLLREAGYSFAVDPADVNEADFPRDLLPAEIVVHLAKMKLAAVSRRHPDDVVLAADTLVAFGDTVLGKPTDVGHAKEMLRLLSGTTHIVVSGVAVGRIATGFLRSDRVMSAVRMRMLSEKEIDSYIQTGAWKNKAGGYGIQDADEHAGIIPAGTEPFVKRISGCHTNVIGLPMKMTARLLEAAGIFPS